MKPFNLICLLVMATLFFVAKMEALTQTQMVITTLISIPILKIVKGELHE